MLNGLTLEAQPVREVEDSIAFYLNTIEKWSLYNYDSRLDKEDSNTVWNNKLLSYLKYALVRHPQTLSYPFDSKILPRMRIASSNDKRFRIYSWDMQGGGTMHGYNSIVQYKSGKEVRTRIFYVDTIMNGEWTGPGYFYPEVHTIVSKNGSTYYAVIRLAQYSSAVHSVGVQCFAINNGLVNDTVKLFKTKNGYLNSIDVEYDDTELKEMTKVPEIHFSSDNTEMYIPLIDNDRYKGKYLVYKFDGYKFVYDKNGK